MKFAFEAMEIDDEIICVPIEASAEQLHGVLKLNASGYEIVKMLKSDITLEEIIEKLSAKYETDPQTIKEYVEKTVSILMEKGLIE